MRVRPIPRPKLTHTLGRERTLGVATFSREGAGAGGEDGRLASREGGRRDEEDEFEASGEGHCEIANWWNVLAVNVVSCESVFGMGCYGSVKRVA
jgi:hypothetical protein